VSLSVKIDSVPRGAAELRTTRGFRGAPMTESGFNFDEKGCPGPRGGWRDSTYATSTVAAHISSSGRRPGWFTIVFRCAQSAWAAEQRGAHLTSEITRKVRSCFAERG
jgi:hypothetical protein